MDHPAGAVPGWKVDGDGLRRCPPSGARHNAEDYLYLVPFPPSPDRGRRGLRRGLAEALRAEADVEDEHTVFLKTIIPSRKATMQHLGEEANDHED